jgi:nucleotide-binding universal stress UspA family protein
VIESILVALDASALAPRVLSAALDLADALDATVVLFRAITIPPEFPPAAHVGQDPLPAFLEREAMEQLEALARGDARPIETELVVSRGQPWRAIVDAARRRNVDLVVLGSHGYHGLDRVLGTTAARVVDHAPCSVHVVREAP